MGRKLHIYYTSDTHGYLFPRSYATNQPVQEGLLSCINDYRKDENTLIIDGGDTIQGSPFTMYLNDSEMGASSIARTLSVGGYDYVTIGNHDINYGKAYLQDYLDHLEAKCLCANISDVKSELPLFKSDIRTMKNGLKVAIVGITTDHINIWEKKEHLTDLKITDPFVAAKAELDKLDKSVDIKIGIYHGGFERDVDTGKVLSDSPENIAYRLADELDFDVLLTRHQHIPMANKVINGTHIAQTPQKSEQYVFVEIEQNDNELSITSELKKPSGDYNKVLFTELLEIEEKVQVYLDEPVGFFKEDIIPQTDKIALAFNGNPVVDFMHEVMLDATGADISATSLANEVKGFVEKVTMRDVVSTYIYPNTLKVLQIDGKLLRSAIEKSVSYFDMDADGNLSINDAFTKPKIAHYNYDFYSVDYVADLSKPHGSRVEKIYFNDKEAQDTDVFRIVVSDYRSTGAGGYDMYKDAKELEETADNIIDIILNYFKKNKEVRVKRYPKPTFLNQGGRFGY